jgi:anti-sigma regulatory factor (Ser/Thr protein kinase)
VDKRESDPPGALYQLAGTTAVRGACEAARAFADAAGLDEGDAGRLCIVAEELVTNVIDHGGATHAQLAFALVGGNVRIELTDSGKPFDPRTTPDPVRTERGGGAGLAIVRTWAQMLSYQSAAGSNRLTLVMALRR